MQLTGKLINDISEKIEIHTKAFSDNVVHRYYIQHYLARALNPGVGRSDSLGVRLPETVADLIENFNAVRVALAEAHRDFPAQQTDLLRNDFTISANNTIKAVLTELQQ